MSVLLSMFIAGVTLRTVFFRCIFNIIQCFSGDLARAFFKHQTTSTTGRQQTLTVFFLEFYNGFLLHFPSVLCLSNSEKRLKNLLFVLFFSTRNRTQHLMLARQALSPRTYFKSNLKLNPGGVSADGPHNKFWNMLMCVRRYSLT